MRRVLITGMSGTGKSSAIQALAALGWKAIDTDWDTEWDHANADNTWVWRASFTDPDCHIWEVASELPKGEG